MEDKIANTINKPFEEHILNEVLSMADERYFEEDSSKKTLIVDSIQSKGTTFNTFFNGIKKFVKETYDTDDYHEVLEGILKNVYFATNSHKEYKGVCKIIGKSHCCLFDSKDILTFGKKGMEGKELHFNKVIMNPPYDIGGKIWDEVREICDYVVCLMPLSKYKGNRCKYIDTYTLTGGDGFDADINENLGITICTNTFHKDYTYSKFEIESYNPKYHVFFKKNLSMNKTIKKYSHSSSKKENEKLDRNSTLVWNRRTVASTFTTKKNSEFMKWNNKEGAPMDSDIFIHNTRPNEWRADIIWFNLPSERDNFWKWCSKGVLGDKLLKALNKSDGSFEDAIPRIDWEKISDHPLWKEGKYDEAVLATMGLKWEGDKIVEVR